MSAFWRIDVSAIEKSNLKVLKNIFSCAKTIPSSETFSLIPSFIFLSKKMSLNIPCFHRIPPSSLGNSVRAILRASRFIYVVFHKLKSRFSALFYGDEMLLNPIWAVCVEFSAAFNCSIIVTLCLILCLVFLAEVSASASAADSISSNPFLFRPCGEFHSYFYLLPFITV